MADHVVDTLDTRFQGVQALATCAVGDRVFVFAGGGDDGLTMMTMTPDGRLVMCGQQLQLPGLALHNISSMTAHLINGKIELFVAGEDAGITRLQVDPGSLSPVASGGPDAATLTGNSGGDMILGGEGAERIVGDAGADILGDGGGADTMFGGAGADTFVLAVDGANDVIGDFQIGIDRIDLSDWGPIHSLAALTITATSNGALVTRGSERLQIISANGLPLLPGSFRLTDFVGLWHPPPLDPNSGAYRYGTVPGRSVAGHDCG